MITAIAILGPTACGKSVAALEVARRIGAEIVSVDSRQAYRRIDIGTAKPSLEDRSRVRHHMIDIIDLEQKNDAAFFACEAYKAIKDIASRGKLPILVGGSGFYFRAICEGLVDIVLPSSARANFALSIKDLPVSELRKRLEKVDPKSAKRIHPNDRYRIVRALEIAEISGITLSEHIARQRIQKEQREVRFVKIGFELPREELHRRIEERACRMIAGGWVEEVASLLNEGVDPEWPGMKTLGYPQIVEHVMCGKSLEDTLQRICELTRQYAKRQITWFKKERDIFWILADGQSVLEQIERIALRSMAGEGG